MPVPLNQDSNVYASNKLSQKRTKSRSIRKALAAARTCLQALEVVAGVTPLLGPLIQSIIDIAVSILSLAEVGSD